MLNVWAGSGDSISNYLALAEKYEASTSANHELFQAYQTRFDEEDDGLRAAGGQGLSNAETLIYLKVVEATRPPVEEVMSRALTLAVRLLGIDGHIKFEFKPIDLRPETELEAYKGSRQKRILEQLSYGLITDAEACYELGVRPQGLAKEFSGTDFYNAKQEAREEGERESSTGRALNPDTPSSSGGDDQ